MADINVIEKLLLYLDKKIELFRKSGEFVINKNMDIELYNFVEYEIRDFYESYIKYNNPMSKETGEVFVDYMLDLINVINKA
jgi:hypothetical protein